VSQIVLAPTPEDAAAEKSRRAPLSWVWRQLKSNPGAATGGIVFLVFLLVSLPARLVAPYDPHATFATGYRPPSPAHWLGLDDGGHDMVSLLIYGTRTSIFVGFGASIIAIVIGVGLGLAAGYWGRATDAGISSITDFFLVIPEVPLMMVIAAVWGQGLGKMILIIGGLLWTWTVRVIRSQVMSVKERVYVRRAKALGATDWRIVTRHVLPQVAPLIIVNFVLTVAVAVFAESQGHLAGADPGERRPGRCCDARCVVGAGAGWGRDRDLDPEPDADGPGRRGRAEPTPEGVAPVPQALPAAAERPNRRRTARPHAGGPPGRDPR